MQKTARLIRQLSPWALTVYWVALFILTHMPVAPGPPASDKLLHFGAYFVLAFLFALTLGVRGWDRIRLGSVVIVTLFGWGAVDELTQQLVGRHCDVWDAAADWLGVLAGLAAFLLVQSIAGGVLSDADQNR